MHISLNVKQWRNWFSALFFLILLGFVLGLLGVSFAPIELNLQALARFGLDLIRAFGLMIFLYIFPGYALLCWLWRGQALSWEEQLGLSAGLSIALYPLLLLWCYVVGVQPGAWLAWLPGLTGSVVWLWRCWQQSARFHELKFWTFNWEQASRYSFVGLLLLLVIIRLANIRTMVAPAWGDSVHHTIITQLMLDQGGLFQSWAPYAPLRTFTYHFGFHIAVANWARISGMDAVQAVLVGGQILNVLAVLVLYPLAKRLAGGNRWAGVAAMLIAGLCSSMPAYYVNWGRYTQLAGQIILPIGLWFFDVWWVEPKRLNGRTLGLLTVLSAGVVLNHYRIGLLLATAGVAWALWGAYQQRGREWLLRTGGALGAGSLAVALVLPWFMIVRTSQLTTLAANVMKVDPLAASMWTDLRGWYSINTYYSPWLWGAATVAFLLALWQARALAWPLLLWGLFSFFATNPFLLRLPGTGWVTNFLVIIALYIPLALALGWLIGYGWRWLEQGWAARGLLCGSLLLLTGIGVQQQLHIVEPFYQIVLPADVDAFTWIKGHIPPDAHFFVNGFPAFYNTVVVGSDAGWWLPLYTQRANSVPPIFYSTERLDPSLTREQLRQLEASVRSSQGDQAKLRVAFCPAGITHVYIGQRQGQAGVGATPSLPAEWLVKDSDFQLLYRENDAQVWSFKRTHCP